MMEFFNNLVSLIIRSPDSDLMASWSDGVAESSSFLRSYVEWELNAMLWISLFIVTFVLSKRLFEIFRLWNQARKIPGPPSSCFFFGHYKTVSRESLNDLLFDSHKRYGSVIRLWLSPTSLLVSIKDPALISEVLIRAEDKLPLSEKAFHLAFGRSSLFASSFNEVEKSKQSLAIKLNRRLDPKADRTPTEAVHSVMEQLSKIMAEGTIDRKMVARNMSLTLLGASLLGDTFLDWSKAAIYEELLTIIAKDACVWASYRVTPFWKREFWKYQCLCRKLKCLTQELLQQCRKNCKLFCNSDESLDVKPVNTQLTAIIRAPKQCISLSSVKTTDNSSLDELPEHLGAEEEPSGNIMGVMFHSLVMAASLIDNILTGLVTHSDIQESIYSEITMVKQSSIKPDNHTVDNMPLLLATVYESARLLPAGNFLQRCSLKHDLRLNNGVIIPAGAMVVVPVQLVQREHSSWGSDAHEFNPYRFLSKASDSGLSTALTSPISAYGPSEVDSDPIHCLFVLHDPKKNPAFLPFGSGSRACPGERFVIQGVATLFSTLLEQYKIETRQGSNHSPPPGMNNRAHNLQSGPDIVFVRREM